MFMSPSEWTWLVSGPPTIKGLFSQPNIVLFEELKARRSKSQCERNCWVQVACCKGGVALVEFTTLIQGFALEAAWAPNAMEPEGLL